MVHRPTVAWRGARRRGATPTESGCVMCELLELLVCSELEFNEHASCALLTSGQESSSPGTLSMKKGFWSGDP